MKIVATSIVRDLDYEYSPMNGTDLWTRIIINSKDQTEHNEGPIDGPDLLVRIGHLITRGYNIRIEE